MTETTSGQPYGHEQHQERPRFGRDRAYDAFISYARVDAPHARRVQTAIERFATRPFAPARYKTYRDDTDLRATADLPAELSNALDASVNFVLICSTSAADSRWVELEAAYWLAVQPNPLQRMIFVIFDRPRESAPDPNSLRARIPPAVRSYADRSGELDQLYFAYVGSGTLRRWSRGDSRKEMARVIATVTDTHIDEVLRRQQRRRNRWLLAACLVLAAIAAAITVAVRSTVRSQGFEDAAAVESARADSSALALTASEQARGGAPVALVLAAESLARVDVSTYESLAALSSARIAFHEQDWHRRPRHFDAPTAGWSFGGSGVSGWGVALSDKGDKVAAMSEAGEILVWDIASGSLYDTAITIDGGRGHSAMAFSPNGTELAVADLDTGIQVWNTETSTPRGQNLGYQSANSLSFNPSGTLLVATAFAGVDNGHIRVWDVETLSLVLDIQSGKTKSISQSLFIDESRIATTDTTSTIRFWDATSGALLHEIVFNDGQGGFTHLALGPAGESLIAVGEHDLAMFNLGDYSRLEVTVPYEPIDDPKFRYGVDPLFLTLYNGESSVAVVDMAAATVTPFSAPQWELPRVPVRVDGRNELLAIGPDGPTLWARASDISSFASRELIPYPASIAASGAHEGVLVNSHGGDLVYWPEGLGGPVSKMTGQVGQVVLAADVSASGRELWTVSGGALLARWEDGAEEIAGSGSQGSESETSPDTMRASGSEFLQLRTDTTMAWIYVSPDSSRLLVGYHNETIELWDLNKRELIDILSESRTDRGLGPPDDPFGMVAVDRDWKFLAVAYLDSGTIRVWPLSADGSVSHDLGPHSALITSLDFGANGRVLGSSDSAGEVRFWSTDSHTLLHAGGQALGQSRIEEVVVADRRAAAAAASTEGSVVRWSGLLAEVTEEVLVQTPVAATSVSMSDDGRAVLAGFEDGKVAIWSLGFDAPIVEADLGEPGIVDTAFSEGDDRAIVMSADGVLRSWFGLLDPTIACSLAEPFVLEEELAAYLPDSEAPKACTNLS